MEYLGLLGVTHVLNTAEGAGAGARMSVNTSQEYYRPAGNVCTVCSVCTACSVCTVCTADDTNHTLPAASINLEKLCI